MTGTELASIERAEIAAPTGGVVMPVASPEEMHNAMVQYQKLKEAVLDKTDYQDAGRGQKFVKKSGWAKLAIAFGVSSSIKDGYPKFFHADDGTLARAEFVVIATAPNGRYAEGWGSCSKSESRFSGLNKNISKLEHDLPATAETRARNRAYAALFGHGEVSYEEVELLGADDYTDAEVVTRHEAQPVTGRNTKQEALIANESLRTEAPAETGDSPYKKKIQAEIGLICRHEQIDSGDVVEWVQKQIGFTGPISAQLHATQERILEKLSERRNAVPA